MNEEITAEWLKTITIPEGHAVIPTFKTSLFFGPKVPDLSKDEGWSYARLTKDAAYLIAKCYTRKDVLEAIQN